MSKPTEEQQAIINDRECPCCGKKLTNTIALTCGGSCAIYYRYNKHLTIKELREKIKKDIEFKSSIRKCKMCDNILTKRQITFCCRKCMGKHDGKRFWTIDKNIKIHKEAVDRLHKDPNFIVIRNQTASKNITKANKNRKQYSNWYRNSTQASSKKATEMNRDPNNNFGTHRSTTAPHERSGIIMRSSWERHFADLLDGSNIHWEYETKMFIIENRRYTCDFFLPEFGLNVEIKPECFKKDSISYGMKQIIHLDLSEFKTFIEGLCVLQKNKSV